MADTRHHRGPHPEDSGDFASAHVPALRLAVHDHSWLLSHNYGPASALKLVGDHFNLSGRQRLAVMRSSCSDLAREQRFARLTAPISGARLLIDGYNVLTTIEAALAGGVLLIGRDGCMRDLASMHGSWRKVEETAAAIRLIGRELEVSGIGDVRWLLDSPVSNSGRLRGEILRAAAEHGWSWQADLVLSPDKLLGESAELIATADSAILDRPVRWINLARTVVEHHIPGAWIIDLSHSPQAPARESPPASAGS